MNRIPKSEKIHYPSANGYTGRTETNVWDNPKHYGTFEESLKSFDDRLKGRKPITVTVIGNVGQTALDL